MDDNTPKIGDFRTIIRGKGYKENQIFIECPLCHEARWTERRNGIARYPICKHHKPTPMTPQAKINNGLAQKRSWAKLEVQQRHSLGQIKRYTNQEEREKQGIRVHLRNENDPTIRERHRNLLLKFWADPEYAYNQRKLMIDYNHKEPTKQEIIMKDILNKYFPNQWKYIGNNSKYIIDKKTPDFIHTNGEKLLIECFGDYWHDPTRNKTLLYHQTYQGRTEFLNSHGYKVLILWEHEIKKSKRKEIVERVKQFMDNSKEGGF
jgi:very-short-patch-repair endonuclease